MNPDLRNASYDEIVEFVFNHLPEDDVDSKWYWKDLDEDIKIDPRQAVLFLTRVCSSAAELVDRFTLRQIAEGVQFLVTGRGQGEFRDQLWNADVPWPERRRCILAIPDLYAQVFELDEAGVGGSAYMLWDSIAYDYFCGSRNPTTNAEDARVQDAMFEALVSMLKSDHRETVRGAIHGLGHLMHRDGNRTLRELLSSSRELDSDVRVYAAKVLEGHFE